MSDLSRYPVLVSMIHPATVAKYIRRLNWKRVPTKQLGIETYQIQENDIREIDIPYDRTSPKYLQMMSCAVQKIAEYQGVPSTTLLFDLLIGNAELEHLEFYFDDETLLEGVVCCGMIADGRWGIRIRNGNQFTYIARGTSEQTTKAKMLADTEPRI